MASMVTACAGKPVRRLRRTGRNLRRRPVATYAEGLPDASATANSDHAGETVKLHER